MGWVNGGALDTAVRESVSGELSIKRPPTVGSAHGSAFAIDNQRVFSIDQLESITNETPSERRLVGEALLPAPGT